jgi:hypothetical protein
MKDSMPFITVSIIWVAGLAAVVYLVSIQAFWCWPAAILCVIASVNVSVKIGGKKQDVGADGDGEAGR